MPVKKQQSLDSAPSKDVDIKFTVLICILLIATIFRFFNLNTAPPGIFQDEAVNTMDALNRPGQVFYQANNGREGLFMNLIAFSFYLLGPSIWSLRIVSAIIGILTVLGTYLLAKQLFKKDFIALLSAFFIAVSFWHVNFSRISFRVIMLPFVFVFFLYFFLKALDNIKEKINPIYNFIIAGLFYGLGFYTYTTYRVSAFIFPVIAFLYWLIFSKKERKVFFQGILVFIFVSAITLAPLAIYFVSHPADFFGRSSQVSIFAQENPIRAGLTSLVYHLGMYNIVGDCNWRHNVACQPQLSWPTGFLFLVGIIISFWIIIENCKVRKIKLEKFLPILILVLCFGATLAPSVLTYEGIPHALRALGTVPFAYIFAAFGAYYLVEKLKDTKSNKKYPEFFNLLGMIFIVLVAFWEYNMYFSVWSNSPEVKGAFGNNYVQLQRVLNKIDSNINVYVIANGQNTTYELEGMKFVEYEGKNFNYKPRYNYWNDWNRNAIAISQGSPVLSVNRLGDKDAYKSIKEEVQRLLDEKKPEELTLIINLKNMGDDFQNLGDNISDLYQTAKDYNLKNFVVIINSNEEILQKIKNSLSQ